MANSHTTCECDVGTVKKFQLVGGDLSVDFTNTLGGKRGVTTREFLNRYVDLLSWFQQAGVVDDEQVGKLCREAEAQPAEAERTLNRAIQLRESIYNLFAAVIERRAASKTDLERLNSELAEGLGRLRVLPVKKEAAFTWGWAIGDGSLGAPLGPVARAAADVLTDASKLDQLRQCGGENCGWLFIDSSKNHSRRWCDMRDCGNRAKVRRHRMKEREKLGEL